MYKVINLLTLKEGKMKNLKIKKLLLIGMAIIIAIAISVPLIAGTGYRCWFSEIFEEGLAFWQYPLTAVVQTDHFFSGPLPDGSGDQDAIVQVDPKFASFAVPLLYKQLPTTVAGTVHGTMHKHPYPELMGFFSTNYTYNEDGTYNSEGEMDLGGTVTVYIGKNMEQHSFDAPTLIYIPANVPHGIVVYGKDITKPIMYFDSFPDGRKGREVPLPKLDRELPDFRVPSNFPDKTGNPPYTSDQYGYETWNPAGGGTFGKYFFSGSKPDSKISLGATQLKLIPGEIPGVDMVKSPLLIYTTENDLMFNNNPMHVPHVHPCDEYLGFFSTDVNDPHNLGMTLRLYIYDSTTHKMVANDFTKPFIGVMQKFKTIHTPMIHKNMTRRNGFIWYATNFEPSIYQDGTITFSDGTVMQVPAYLYATSGQRHNLYYTHNQFNGANGVATEDLPVMSDINGDDRMMCSIEPHLGWACSKCHGVYVPALK
jgi:hypothetical protein